MPLRRYLVVANQTLGLAPLDRTVRQLLAPGPCELLVVVPTSGAPGGGVSARVAEEDAARRLEGALEHWRARGATASGELTGSSPVVAIADALRGEPFDAVILSTLSPGASRPATPDAPRRLERAFGVPVISVVAPDPDDELDLLDRRAMDPGMARVGEGAGRR